MNAPRYGKPAIALHWLQAALVLSLLVIGWTMADMPKGPDKTWTIALHKSLGICAFMLLLLRAAWRWHHPPPPMDEGWQGKLAAITHRLLYLLLLLAPLFGYLSASFTKYPMKLFGTPIPKAGWPDESINAVFNLLHKGSVWTLAILIGLHLAGAMYHLLRRDGMVARMLPTAR